MGNNNGIIGLSLFVFIGRIADYISTYYNIYVLGEVEANPFMAVLVPNPIALMVAQLMLTALFVYLLSFLYTRYPDIVRQNVKNKALASFLVKASRITVYVLAIISWLGFINNIEPHRLVANTLYSAPLP
jgi:small-conductance mechanosensitive channel